MMRDPVERAIDLFAHANLVGLGERHWARQDSQFRLRLIRHAEFRRAGADIVVEFASALHQDLLDRFVQGEDVPAPELRAVWRDTTQPGAWDSPVYEEFFRAVREVNHELPDGPRLRVLAGDPPVDWNASAERIRDGLDTRDPFAASVIGREVLGRGRKALVVYGALHLCRKRAGTIAELLRDDARARWFTIVPVDGDDGSPTEGALVNLPDSPLGEVEANDLFAKGTQLPARIFQPGVKLRDVADGALCFAGTPEFVPRPPGIAGSEYGGQIDRRRAVLRRLAASLVARRDRPPAVTEFLDENDRNWRSTCAACYTSGRNAPRPEVGDPPPGSG